MKFILVPVLSFLICGVASAKTPHPRGWICKLSFTQSADYYCRFTYELAKFDPVQQSDIAIASFQYENDTAPNNGGCTEGGVDNGGAARQLKNALAAAASLKAEGICRVVLKEF